MLWDGARYLLLQKACSWNLYLTIQNNRNVNLPGNRTRLAALAITASCEAWRKAWARRLTLAKKRHYLYQSWRAVMPRRYCIQIDRGLFKWTVWNSGVCSLFTKQSKAGDWFSKNVFPGAEFLPQANIPLEAGWHWDVESNVLDKALLGEKGYYDRNDVVSPCYSQPAWFFSVIVTLLSLLNALWWHLAKENGEPWTRPLTLDNHQSRSTFCLAWRSSRYFRLLRAFFSVFHSCPLSTSFSALHSDALTRFPKGLHRPLLFLQV